MLLVPVGVRVEGEEKSCFPYHHHFHDFEEFLDHYVAVLPFLLHFLENEVKVNFLELQHVVDGVEILNQ